jgi:hypothetical protein
MLAPGDARYIFLMRDDDPFSDDHNRVTTAEWALAMAE